MTKKYNDMKRECTLQLDELNRVTLLKSTAEQELEEKTDQVDSLKKELARQTRGGGYVTSQFYESTPSTPTPSQYAQPAALFKKSPWHTCFPVNFSKFLRTPFLQNISGGWFLQPLESI